MLFHDFFNVGSFPRLLEVSTLNNTPKESAINGYADKEVKQKKLYKLIIKAIPEIKYKDIKTYTLDSMPKFEYYANFMQNQVVAFVFMN